MKGSLFSEKILVTDFFDIKYHLDSFEKVIIDNKKQEKIRELRKL